MRVAGRTTTTPTDAAAATAFATDTIYYLPVDPIAAAAVGVRVCDGVVDGDAQVEVSVFALDALGCPSPTPCALALEPPWHPLPS